LYNTPVIGAAAGGVQEVIQEGKTGFLIPYGDRELLAIRITQVLDDRALACRMGERGRKKVLDHHTWERVYANVKPVYEAFID
jgi:glycosyltransferase involved in cell wall biosynthesis